MALPDVKTPKWLSVTFKVLGVLIVFVLGYFYVMNDLATHVETCEAETAIRRNKKIPALKNTQSLLACVERENWFLENWLMRDAVDTVHALPNAPCKYVGVWESTRPQCKYKVTLKESGEYTGTPIACNISSSNYTGTWGVHENRMVWLDNIDYRWPLDINSIEAESRDAFVLIEVNGSRTQFTRIEAASPATGCVKPTAERAIVAAASAVATASASAVTPASVASAPVAATPLAATSAPAAAPVQVASAPTPPALPVATAGPARKKIKSHPPARRKPSDLRYCLELSGNYAIAKCATVQK